MSRWDTSLVTDMSYVFYGASAFDQDVSSWNTSRVSTMYAMFLVASLFNGDISSWDTSSTTDMALMFYGASAFNQNLCAWADTFPYNSADDIFSGSGCLFQESPRAAQKGPFCSSSCSSLN